MKNGRSALSRILSGFGLKRSIAPSKPDLSVLGSEKVEDTLDLLRREGALHPNGCVVARVPGSPLTAELILTPGSFARLSVSLQDHSVDRDHDILLAISRARQPQLPVAQLWAQMGPNLGAGSFEVHKMSAGDWGQALRPETPRTVTGQAAALA